MKISTLTLLCLVLANAIVFAQSDKPSKAASPKATATPKTTASPKSNATATPATGATAKPTPETKIDAKMEAELLQAEDRFIIAIRNRDAKALDELMHPGYADSFDGSERAITKKGILLRLPAGTVPAYRIDNKRKLTRSGDAFTVEGIAIDATREESVDPPNKPVEIRRIWERQGDRWIVTAQIVKREEEGDEPEVR